MAEQEVRRYRDCYGQEAVAIADEHGCGWKLTFVRGRDGYTRRCCSYQQMRAVLDANGYGWTEVDSWRITRPA